MSLFVNLMYKNYPKEKDQCDECRLCVKMAIESLKHCAREHNSSHEMLIVFLWRT